MQAFYCLTGEWINPRHRRVRQFIGSANICYISIHERLSKLKTFVYIAVTKGFTDDHSSVNLPSFSNMEAYLGQNL